MMLAFSTIVRAADLLDVYSSSCNTSQVINCIAQMTSNGTCVIINSVVNLLHCLRSQIPKSNFPTK